MQPNGPPARRILVVCLGNHCRSPLAAAILARRGGTGVDVRSAGLTHHHVDQPAHPQMVIAAKALGYDISGHRGARLTPHLLAWTDLVLAMDQTIVEQLQHIAAASDRPKVRLYLPGVDVPDPWGKAATDFTACAALIDTGASQHLTAYSPPRPGERDTARSLDCPDPSRDPRIGQACPSTARSASTDSA